MKDKILEVLRKTKRPAGETYLYDRFKGEFELKDICDTLREMEKNGEIYATRKGEYILFEQSHMKVGRLSVNKKGFGFVLLENEPDIHIREENMNGAIHNDLVAAEYINKEEGKIVKVIDRPINNYVGEFMLDENGKGIVKIDDDRIKYNIVIEDKDRDNVMPGYKVIVKPNEKIRDNTYKGIIVKSLGHKDKPGVDILSIVYENEINDVFQPEVDIEVDNIPFNVDEKDKVGRVDLREKVIFTIDGDDAKDFDDAVCVEELPNGNYKLGVHIADVEHYVKEDSAIDVEAADRGNSVYLVDRVIPMLPHKLSNGICSLNPNVDRLTMSCDMEINSSGKVVAYDIYESIINSKKRMTYKEVNKILDSNEDVPGYENFKDKILLMNKLAGILRANKMNRGYINFDIPEIKIIVDEEGRPINIEKRESGSGEKLIEDFMIAANEAVAEHVFNLDLPFIYRVHEKPKKESIKKYFDTLNALGHRVKGDINKITPKFMQQILESLKDSEDYAIISQMGLRSMTKADYRIDNLGHFGLASTCYTHFTSPIRRYSDLTIHRFLKKYNKGEVLNIEALKQVRDKLVRISEHCSLKERSATNCERDVNDMKSAEYMEGHIEKEYKDGHIGEEYSGLIAGIIPVGLFVRLDNLIEGFIHISTLGREYSFNERTQSLIGKNSKDDYKLGGKVMVKVISASKSERTIDFELVKTKK